MGFSPERVDPGNAVYHTKNTPKVVGAIGKDATEVIAAMYRTVLDGDIHEVSSPAVAEMEKILENTYRNINIGLVNELCILCEKMGISAWEVIDAAISAGANELSSLNFTVSDSSGYMEEARRLAVEQAYEKASVLAEASGAKLGRVMQISEQSYTQPLYKSNMMVTAEADAATPVQAGKQDITVSVNVLYELK